MPKKAKRWDVVCDLNHRTRYSSASSLESETIILSMQPDRVRVWWEPTDNKSRDGYAGAYWPAKVLAKYKNKMRVQYDNGDAEVRGIRPSAALSNLTKV